MAGSSRGKAMREARRAAQFSKFRLVNLNLVPLVDTFVSIVFFALTTQTLGAVAPVAPGVTLPESEVRTPTQEQLTLGIGSRQVLLGHGEEMQEIMSTQQAATSASNNPQQPLLIPGLYAALAQRADSIREANGVDANASVDVPLAIQAEKTMRYDLLARVMQTARLAGFRNLTLQVLRAGADEQGAAPPARTT